MKIVNVHARQILDSRGYPTVEAEVTLEDGVKALGQVPSGTSTGAAEATELRDNNPDKYFGKGVLTAIENVKTHLKEILVGQDAYDQPAIDRIMIEADGTDNKARFGGNAILGCSMAICRATARSQNIELYEYFGKLSGNTHYQLPQPMILIMEGGKHGSWSTDIQEFMIVPKKESFASFAEMLEAGAEVFHTLKKILTEKQYGTGVGYEGAFCPQELKSNEEAFELISQAIEKSGHKLNDQFVFAIDAAASEFYEDGHYVLHSEADIKLTSEEWYQKMKAMIAKFPVWSIEDLFSENDWEYWSKQTAELGAEHQIMGDDLTATNTKLIQKAADQKAINSVLIKLNQIGTITETLEAIKLCDQFGFATIISHRGGETNDSMTADLVVGSSSWQSKFGGPDRGERLAKYNRLLRIEEQLSKT